jgi:CBS domain containing-hemolysin-like protein
MSAWSAFGVSLAMLVLNGVFVALEFSLVASRRTKLEELAAGGSVAAGRALDASGDLSLQLAGAQLGITVASLVLGLVAEPAMAHLLGPVVGAVGLSGTAAHSLAVVIGLSVVVFLHLVVGELVPKSIALAGPERTLRWLSVPNAGYLFVCRPVVRVLNWMGNRGARLFGVQALDELSSTPTAEELTLMLGVSRDEGLIEDFAHELLTGVLDFGGHDVSSVMASREEIRAISLGTTVREAEALVVDSGHSRLPVQGAGGLDDVLGFVHAKDLLTVSAASAERPLPLRLVRRMLVVPVDRSLEDLLLAMRRARVHFALVTGADGATAGIVTLEDLLEELVGDILDESDPG